MYFVRRTSTFDILCRVYYGSTAVVPSTYNYIHLYLKTRRHRSTCTDMIKSRPSPTASATLFPKGHVIQGNDGRMYQVMITVSGVHRWTPVRSRHCSREKRGMSGTVRVVTTVDNGGKPFQVHLTSVVGPGTAHVYVWNETTNVYEYWKSFQYLDVLIGLDPDEHFETGKAKAKKRP